MIKTLLALSGTVLLTVPALHAQEHRFSGGRPAIDRGHYGMGNHGYGYGGYRHGDHHGRYYYYGGTPYFFPYYGLGFGYPGYYDGGGFGGYGYGYGGDSPAAYEGRIENNDSDADKNGRASNRGPSLPEAVQRQLSKKGYYKGDIDGQFGPASRSAVSRFQRDNDLRETGRIDEPTLDALGFTDHR